MATGLPYDLYCHLSQQHCHACLSITHQVRHPIIWNNVLSWQFVACWVLPNFTRTAATRSHKCVTLSPCSQSHARLARHITVPAGGLLPHPFTPYRHLVIDSCDVVPAGILSVAVVVSHPLLDSRPHLRFRGATFPPYDGAGVGKFLCWV